MYYPALCYNKKFSASVIFAFYSNCKKTILAAVQADAINCSNNKDVKNAKNHAKTDSSIAAEIDMLLVEDREPVLESEDEDSMEIGRM